MLPNSPQVPVKTCPKCGEEKTIDHFANSKKGLHRKACYCKPCATAVSAEWVKANKEKARESIRKWRDSPAGKTWMATWNNANKSRRRGSVQKYRSKPNNKWKAIQKDAQKRSLAFEISIEAFVKDYWQKSCNYCDLPTAVTGLDRIDNAQGYTISNIVPCCHVCNFMKGVMSLDAFLAQCRKIDAWSKKASE